MPQLTFPVLSRELTLPVFIGITRRATLVALAAGGPILAPVATTGMIDTGTSITCVAGQVIRQLGLTRVARASTQTVAGQVAVDLFEVSLTLGIAGGQAGPVLVQPDLVVMELSNPPPGVDVLIGMDILLDSRFLLDGPGRQFFLDW